MDALYRLSYIGIRANRTPQSYPLPLLLSILALLDELEESTGLPVRRFLLVEELYGTFVEDAEEFVPGNLGQVLVPFHESRCCAEEGYSSMRYAPSRLQVYVPKMVGDV